MNRTLRKCCAALLAILAVYAAPAAEKTVYLKDFLAPGAAGTDAVPAVRAALEHCAEVGASRLVLPGGRLRMRPDRAVEKYQFISNNDESLKRIAFDLVGMRDFEIDGNGTELLFTGFISPFSLEDCENITVRDLTIDFTRTFNSEGTVVAKGDGWLEIEFPEDYLCDIVNGCLRFRDAEGTVYPFSNLLEFDAVRREPAFRATDYWLSNRTIPAEKCANGNIRILRKDLTATVGNVMVFGAAARYNPGFTLADCRGVAIRDVNLYHCGGMGVIAQRSRDIELRKLVIVPSPGKGRMISITADATHYVNCGGYIRMIDCTFENQKDDATNIHGLYMAVEKVGDADKLLLRWRNSGQYGVDFIVPGMTLELVDNNNVETYANVPQIILKGADWFASMGTEKSKGTKVFALGGKIKNTGLVEIPMGTTLRTIVEEIGGGIPGGKKFKAAQTGGPSGGCIPASLIDTPIDYDNLLAIGSMMGSGGLIVMDEDTCMVDIAKFFLEFTVDESCGKCTPCRVGTKRLLELLNKITDGKGTMEDLDKITELAEFIKSNSLCGLGQTAPNPVLSTLRYFRDEYVEHIVNKRCPAGVCKALLNYKIDPVKCKGCTLCARTCPAGAISGTVRQPHTIDTAKCVKCGACIEKCKFGAISKG